MTNDAHLPGRTFGNCGWTHPLSSAARTLLTRSLSLSSPLSLICTCVCAGSASFPLCSLRLLPAVFSNLHSYLHSLRKIHRHRPRRIYPAHGPLIDGADAPARIEQYIAHRAAREDQIVQTLRRRHDELAAAGHLQHQRDQEFLTASDIVRRICQPPTAAAAHACAHLYERLPPAGTCASTHHHRFRVLAQACSCLCSRSPAHR